MPGGATLSSCWGPWVSSIWAQACFPGKWTLPALFSQGLRPRGSGRVGLLQGQVCEIGVLTLLCTLAILNKYPGPLFQEALRTAAQDAGLPLPLFLSSSSSWETHSQAELSWQVGPLVSTTSFSNLTDPHPPLEPHWTLQDSPRPLHGGNGPAWVSPGQPPPRQACAAGAPTTGPAQGCCKDHHPPPPPVTISRPGVAACLAVSGVSAQRPVKEPFHALPRHPWLPSWPSKTNRPRASFRAPGRRLMGPRCPPPGLPPAAALPQEL